MTQATLTANKTIAAYDLEQFYTFRVLLVKGDLERCEVIKSQGDRFCNLVAAVNQAFPGWAVRESWEVAGF